MSDSIRARRVLTRYRFATAVESGLHDRSAPVLERGRFSAIRPHSGQLEARRGRELAAHGSDSCEVGPVRTRSRIGREIRRGWLCRAPRSTRTPRAFRGYCATERPEAVSQSLRPAPRSDNRAAASIAARDARAMHTADKSVDRACGSHWSRTIRPGPPGDTTVCTENPSQTALSARAVRLDSPSFKASGRGGQIRRGQTTGSRSTRVARRRSSDRSGSRRKSIPRHGPRRISRCADGR